jgi:hypothetical protein
MAAVNDFLKHLQHDDDRQQRICHCTLRMCRLRRRHARSKWEGLVAYLRTNRTALCLMPPANYELDDLIDLLECGDFAPDEWPAVDANLSLVPCRGELEGSHLM